MDRFSAFRLLLSSHQPSARLITDFRLANTEIVIDLFRGPRCAVSQETPLDADHPLPMRLASSVHRAAKCIGPSLRSG